VTLATSFPYNVFVASRAGTHPFYPAMSRSSACCFEVCEYTYWKPVYTEKSVSFFSSKGDLQEDEGGIIKEYASLLKQFTLKSI